MKARPLVIRHFHRQRGWFKIWREIFSHDIWLNRPESWFRVFFALVGTANHEPGILPVGDQDVEIPRGGLVIGTDEFSSFCRVTRQQLRSALQFLQRTNAITIQTTSKGTIITLVNWAIYQGTNGADNQPDSQPETQVITSAVTTPATSAVTSAVTTIQEEKKRRRKEEKPPSKLDLLVEPFAARIHDRHPQARRCSLSVVKAKLKTIAKDVPEEQRPALLDQIDQCHAVWCESEDWRRGYAKGLENWLAPTM